ncbi:alpha-1,2-Mannosidase [Mycena kentingensis (nom. inval.)]|nr:alpha-1,2-Mannosidase [Mycena kentingensis (nom. inval.)]
MRDSRRPGALEILRHRPFLYTALTVVLILGYFLWDAVPQASLDVRDNARPNDAYAFPKNTKPEVWDQRAELVRKTFIHAYDGYEEYAAPHDELRPLTNGFSNKFNGWGVTAVDALDTMLIMKLNAQYSRTLARLSKSTFPMPEGKVAPFFETVIRYLGGYLSAYPITQDPALLKLAEDLAQKLDPAFEQYGKVFPVYGVNTADGQIQGPEIGFLAEMASLQLEYLYLAKATGQKRYYDRARNVIDTLANADLRKTGGMLPVSWNLTTGQPHDEHLSVGGRADSAHEYLLKEYLLTAKTDKKSLNLYIQTTYRIITDLLYLSPHSPPALRDRNYRQARPHAQDGPPLVLPAGAARARRAHAPSGRPRLFYPVRRRPRPQGATHPTGLAPDHIIVKTADTKGIRWIDEVVRWRASSGKRNQTPPGVGERPAAVVYSEQERATRTGRGRDYALRDASYFLRPETVESLYILWRVTGQSRWREMGWKIFQSIERETKTPAGYASLRTVEVSPGIKEDDMPSFFLAETLKYLYLLFTNADLLPLDRWVFNTEAHPLPVFEWTGKERAEFGMAGSETTP